MISNSLPQKELDSSSMNSTPIEKEPVMECPLLLTTLSGVTFKVSLSVAKFDRFTDLEDQVMDYLASVTDLQVFGCVIDFLHTTTQTYLEDPIWDKLQQGREYTIVFRDCSVTLLEQEQLGGYPIDQVPLAVHVPMNSEETVPEWAFAGVPRLRHVSVESGIRLIGAEAWQDCRQLRIVKLPATVVGIADNAFRDCKLLNSVLAPGCRDFGYKAFSEWTLFLAACVCIGWSCKRVQRGNQFRAIPLPGGSNCRHGNLAEVNDRRVRFQTGVPATVVVHGIANDWVVPPICN